MGREMNEEDAFLVFNFYRDIYRKTHETLYGTIELNEPDGEAEFEDDLDACRPKKTEDMLEQVEEVVKVNEKNHQTRLEKDIDKAMTHSKDNGFSEGYLLGYTLGARHAHDSTIRIPFVADLATRQRVELANETRCWTRGFTRGYEQAQIDYTNRCIRVPKELFRHCLAGNDAFGRLFNKLLRRHSHDLKSENSQRFATLVERSNSKGSNKRRTPIRFLLESSEKSASKVSSKPEVPAPKPRTKMPTPKPRSPRTSQS